MADGSWSSWCGSNHQEQHRTEEWDSKSGWNGKYLWFISQHSCIHSRYLDVWRSLVRKWISIDGYYRRCVDLPLPRLWSFISTTFLDDNTEQPLLEDRDPIVQYGPHLPQAFLKVIPHSNSANQTSSIIPLVGNSLAGESAASYVPQPENRPWAPFRTLEDFEVTELAITSLMPKKGITKLLAGVTGKWSNGKSPVTLKKYSDMDAILFKARKYVVQVCSILQTFNLTIWI